MLMMAVSMTAAASENATSSKEYLDTLNVGVAATASAGTATAAAETTGDDSMAVDENATSSKEYLDTLSAGVTTILTPDIVNETSGEQYLLGMSAGKSVDSGTFRGAGKKGTDAKEEEESDLVMADVQNALNVRAEASEEAEKVGLLYKDCGGRILERKDGWTKIKSGDLIGWAKDEYLLFDEEAESLAGEVGNLIVTIETDALRVRKEPNTESGVFALIAQDDELDVIEVVNDEWISVDYQDEVGYVSAEFVDMDFHIDAGETMDVIRAREKAEAEARAKARLTANQGAVVAGADETRLLAALIYCEAGNQGYEGQLAVGAAVMNRVRSGAYPNSISGVIYASGQFTPAYNGRLARAYGNNIPDSCFTAAQESLNGGTNIGSATHFRRAGSHEGLVIGDHVFW
jgi:Cell wall hydrolyses involved in spore germination